MSTSPPRKAYPSDVSDDEWEFAAPYLALMSLDALQRKHDLRAVFNAVRYLAHTGAPWRYLPSDFPPWPAVYQQARRWLDAGCFEALVHDLRLLLRVLQGRQPQPSAAILDARVLQSSPESGARAGYSGYKRRKGSKVHAAVDTLGHLLALVVTPASADERTPVGALAAEVQAVTGEHVAVAFVDQGYTGEEPATAAAEHGIQLEVVKLPEAKRGFVLLPKRWIIERTQPHYLQSALDVQAAPTHDRPHWTAEPACRGRATARSSAGLSACSTGSWCAMSTVLSRPENRASAPPRRREHPCAVAGTACRQPIGTSSCVCSLVSSNDS